MPTLSKRSLLLSGHATSLALEPAFWAVLERMAAAQGSSLPALVARIDEERGPASLASACRVRALHWAGGNPV
jgi:predicted DNA-binding ribbon-helix-helix protein